VSGRFASEMRLGVAAAIAAITLGCAPVAPISNDANDVAASSVRKPALERQPSMQFGVIRTIRSVRVAPEQTGAGIAGGAVLGGVLGNKIGKGKGRKLATVLGALAGGAAGAGVESRVRARRMDELVVALDSGRAITIVQPEQLDLTAGDRVAVRLLDGELHATRLERARIRQ
jgi:outer membrane lipoprotein SlyB